MCTGGREGTQKAMHKKGHSSKTSSSRPQLAVEVKLGQMEEVIP